MLRYFLLMLLSFFSLQTMAAEKPPVVGEIIALNGDAERMFLVSKPEVNKRETRPLKLFRKVFLGDLILTHNDSSVLVKLHDGSRILLGPNSSVELRDINVSAAKPRKLVVYQNWGKLRLKIAKRGRFKDVVQLRSKFLTVGMKNGTEVLSNIYQVNSKTSNDIMVLKKSAQILASDFSKKARVLRIKSGEFFNNKMIDSKRWWDLPRLSNSVLSFIKKTPKFLLPNLQKKDGSFLPLKRSILKTMSNKQTISWRQSSLKK